MICTACGDMFLYAQIVFRLRHNDDKYVCPSCKATNTLRDATAEEIASVVPAPTRWVRLFTWLLWAIIGGGVLFIAYILYVTKGQA